ncbi:Translocation SEC62 [Lecanosticta acicola]|uniref:Translocation protein SEC62 n=1 Tax=Lecanosticta acicola TaxID=111012 RepID=A0AAI8Z7F5_9PEZI|nr:Translocation SEC62 [Lecanosticta acicola]
MSAPPPLQPGQQPTPEQIQQIQQQIAAEAQKAGLSVPEYVERMKAQYARQAQAQQQQQQQGTAQPGQQQPIQPGPPKPEALAVANFLRNQDLKTRTCIFQQQRKDMFKVKRAIRALHSPAYEKARKKNPLLPEVKDRVTAENCFKLLPMSLLALRVQKVDPHEGHDHGKKKRVKGLWTIQVVPQQEASDEFYYVWLYEGSQWKNKLYAVGALAGILAVVFFPVWPMKLRLGVWYLSMAMLGVLGLFFAMAIFRLILFLITFFTVSPGLWLYPNLFEDVGFFDSFRPVWAWHEDEKAMKKRKKTERMAKKERRAAKADGDSGKKKEGDKPSEPIVTAEATTTSSAEAAPAGSSEGVQQRNLNARVEEVEE